MTQNTPDFPSSEATEAAPRGLTRRQVAVGAAWAAPVIALAAATPLAAASGGGPSDATSISGATSTVSTNPSTVVPGDYPGVQVTSAFTNGYLQISNIIGTWDTGILRLDINNAAGGTSTARSIVDQNGNTVPTGASAIGRTYVAGGIVWTVTASSSTLLTLTAPSQSVAAPGPVTFPAPAFTVKATYNGTWEQDDEGQWPVYSASYVVSAGNVAGGGGATGTFPADPYAPPVN